MSDQTENKHIAEIDGARTKTLPTFYRKIARELEFPKYFNANLDALEDCVTDLSWLQKKHVVLFIKNSDLLLAAEDVETRDSVMDILSSATDNQTESDRRFEVAAER